VVPATTIKKKVKRSRLSGLLRVSLNKFLAKLLVWLIIYSPADTHRVHFH
jgi:hypothetical protein